MPAPSSTLLRLRRMAQFAAVCALVACAGDRDPVAPPDDENVTDVYTPGVVFSPFTAEIDVGGMVRFHITRAPDGDGHNVIFRPSPAGAPANIEIVADTMVARVFMTAGTFPYDCFVHPGMSGEIVVH